MTHVCIAPACPVNCNSCQFALDPAKARLYARRYVALRDNLQQVARDTSGLGSQGIDNAVDKVLDRALKRTKR
jgi:hypothetical protein